MQTVIAIDTSGSINLISYSYYSIIDKIILKNPNAKLISWNSDASFVKSYDYFRKHKGFGFTKFSNCLQLLDTLKYKFHLIITTDGRISDESRCRQILKNSQLFDYIQSVKIHFIGEESLMNLEIISLFDEFETAVSVNGNYRGKSVGRFEIDNLQSIENLDDLKLQIISNYKNIDKDKMYLKLSELKTNS